MPIAYARLEFVKRSAGKNACGKAAYNSRCRIEFEGSRWQEPRTYNWSSKEPPVYHEVLLPKGADSKLQSPEALWNHVEQKEGRRNSQSALEMVIALPDDKVISLEDKIHLARSFVQEHFVKHGLGVQLDIHPPDKKVAFSEERGEYETADHNWHAHALVTTRRFKGKELGTHKARDLMPVMRKGYVVSGQNWGKLWAQHQNTYFEEKGLSLRVDPEGVVSQRHLGPVRMRGRAFSLMEENSLRISLNALEAENPKKVLDKITQTQNIFTQEDVGRFLYKHVDPEKVLSVQEAFWMQSQIVQLLDPKTQKPLGKFTTHEILQEERQIIRIADRLMNQPAYKLTNPEAPSILTSEQKQAFQGILQGKKLALLEGHAGTGKSYLLTSLKQAYESEGRTVRGFGPDSATSQVLQEKGFSKAENVYRFLFSLQNGSRSIGKNEVWILDEAGKLGSRPLLELLKKAYKHGAQVILSGNSAQMSSVERGVGFHFFSQKYGAHHLENIQRQNEEAQKEIAQKLAHGKMGSALDEISKLGNLKWTPTKEDAIETLVKNWAQNNLTNPNEKTLILAHSNKEIRTLNEFARQYRRQVGELEEKEYQCSTAFGTLFVSCGDRIEFRKNDSELGVTNGLGAILVKASERRFTVQTQEGRQITFDPRTYQSFQLGYATTYYRSQGRTVDRAYVLHSSLMNKEMFYVGLTRHVKNVEYYVSEEEAKNLIDLKRQAYKHHPKESTLNYLTLSDLEEAQAKELKTQTIQELKTSPSLTSKLKGHALSTWEGISGKTQQLVEKTQDKRPSQTFFNPDIEKKTPPGFVQKVLLEEEERKELNLQNLEKPKPSPPSPQKRTPLPDEKQPLLKAYFQAVEKASTLYTIVKSEEEVSETKSPHHSEWQKACSLRNEHAFELHRACTPKELKAALTPRSYDYLLDRVAKYEQTLSRNSRDLDSELTDHLEALLYRLFPDGPTRKDHKGMRFGSKGSLSVHLTGSNAGLFYDFEEQVGGGPLHLIERTLSCTPSQARKYAQEFLGEAPNLPIPTHFAHKKALESQEFISLKPDPNIPPPPLKELSKGLAFYCREKMRHTYRDEDGNPLFHILRLEDKTGKKTILPVSYGYFQGGEPTWTVKGYQALPRPLYNLHLLKEQPNARVLIVEGEKAADHANTLFPGTIALTWSGGAGAVDKSDWNPLFLREVVIWPDNDKAGYEAAESICQNLRTVGVKSLHAVDKQLLASLPPKWDLADPLSKKEQFIKDALLRATERGIGLPTFLSHLKVHSLQVDTQTAIKALSHAEETLRPLLSQDLTPPEIRSHILKLATQSLLSSTFTSETPLEDTKKPQEKALELENSL